MNTQLKRDTDILGNAPEGTTHFITQDRTQIYFKFDGHWEPTQWCGHKEGWRSAHFYEFKNVRALKDLERVIYLRSKREDYARYLRIKNETVVANRGLVMGMLFVCSGIISVCTILAFF